MVEMKTAPAVRLGLFKIRFDTLGGGREEGSGAEQDGILGISDEAAMN